MDGTETDAIYHVESIHRLISSLRAEKSSGPVKPDWLHWNPEANCRETLAAASNRSCEQFCR
jgi:hypothetical protein